MWCIPCGHVDEQETLEESARREFKEETGLDVEIGAVCFAHQSLQRPDRPVVGTWFWGRRVGGELQAGDDAAEVRFFGFDALPADLAFDGDKLFLEKLRRERLEGKR